jgi:signal peptidase
MKRIANIIYYALFALLLVVASVFLASLFPIPGNVELKIVQSGSMEPAVPVGSLVVIKPSEQYRVGDIITFGADTKTQVPTTHRILSVDKSLDGTTYTTKGDANEEADPSVVHERDIIGKVLLDVPYAGYVLHFAKQPLGFALVIGVPAILIIFDELFTIFGELKKMRGARSRAPLQQRVGEAPRTIYRRRRVADDMFIRGVIHITPAPPAVRRTSGPLLSLGALATTLSLLLGSVGGTVSYFSDLERSLGNILMAGQWESSGSAPEPFTVVLNEFLPNPDDEANGLDFGNDASNMPEGEWVELYNKGADPVDVAGWYITDASGGGGNTHAVISDTNTNTGDTIVLPGGWLVVYMNKPTLNNTGDDIFLYSDTDIQADFYSYDNPSDFCELEPTPGNSNNDSNGSGTPGNGPNADCSDNQVAPNKSYARIPDGTGAWVDPVPTPGAANVAEDDLGPPQSVGGGASDSSPVAPEPEEPVIDEPLEPEELIQEPVDEPVVEPEPTPEPTPEPEITAPEPEVVPEVTETPVVEPPLPPTP